MKKEVKEIMKTVISGATYIGAGAVIGCLLKNADLRSLKGLGKICAGIGIIGLSHAAGQAAGDTLSKEVDNLCGLVDEIQSATESEDEEEVEQVAEA